MVSKHALSQSKGTALPRLDIFRKVLALERDRGHPDRAVSGGLDRFLAHWRQEADHPADQEVFRLLQEQGLLDTPYAELGTGSRARWVERATRCIEAGGGQAPLVAPATNDAPKPKQVAASRISRLPSPGRSLQDPVTLLRSVNRSAGAALGRLGVITIEDLLHLFPHRHNDFSRLAKIAELVPGEEQTVAALVWEIREVKMGRSMRAAEAVIGDETGNIRVVWYNQPYLARTIQPNTQVVLSGRVGVFRGARVLESPEYEALERQEDLIHAGRLVPVYPLTEGLRSRTVRRATKEALDGWGYLVRDHLPSELLRRNGLLELPQAIRQAHYPDNQEARRRAYQRLAFDELFLMQLLVLSRRREWRDREDAVPLRPPPGVLESFLAALPFQLTATQQRALDDIARDLESTRPMSRLLQGEVGSGKTVVALAALLTAAASGYQASIMAPTEILAEQHFRTVAQLLGELSRPSHTQNTFSVCLDNVAQPISVGLLIGSQSRKVKEETYRRLEAGSLDIIIGTHALIQEGVSLPKLALAVVDEQHRFGVAQRAALRQMGRSPHVLVMSATPIPRSLALTLYGDLDISIMDELPEGRRGVTTRWVPTSRRPSAYQFVREQVRQGRQAFVLCPLVEESEVIQVRAATEEYERLSQEVFSDLRLGLLHARLPTREKQEVMDRFRSGDLDILVATPVVEVGVDVPNATIMLVEGANRFGLSQLHQLRGRVGRGEYPGYCLLLADSAGEEAKRRLSAMERLKDGFAVAEEDLKLRGPGDFLGTRQSGLPELRIASLDDQPLLTLARREATELLAQDAALEEYPELAQALASYHQRLATDIS